MSLPYLPCCFHKSSSCWRILRVAFKSSMAFCFWFSADCACWLALSTSAWREALRTPIVLPHTPPTTAPLTNPPAAPIAAPGSAPTPAAQQPTPAPTPAPRAAPPRAPPTAPTTNPTAPDCAMWPSTSLLLLFPSLLSTAGWEGIRWCFDLPLVMTRRRKGGGKGFFLLAKNHAHGGVRCLLCCTRDCLCCRTHRWRRCH